jgi:hypothetical protein
MATTTDSSLANLARSPTFLEYAYLLAARGSPRAKFLTNNSSFKLKILTW